MKIRIFQADLKRVLEAVAPVAPATGPFRHLRIDTVDSDQAKAMAVNEEMGMSVSFACEVLQEGTIALPAGAVRQYVSKLPAGNVTIETKGGTVLVETESGAAVEFLSVDPADIPTPASVEYHGPTLSAESIALAVDGVAFAASADSSRPVLNGVYLIVRDGLVTVAATDSYRMARARFPVRHEDAFSAIVPSRALSVIKRMAEAAGYVEIGAPIGGSGRLGVRAGSAELIVRLIEGVYPDLDQVIPKTSELVATVDRHALIQVLQRLVVVAHPDTHRIGLNIMPSQILFDSNDAKVGSGRDRIPAVVSGTSMEISVNGEFFLQILTRMIGDRCTLAFSGPQRAFSISPDASALPEGWDMVYVLMPLNRSR